jgi:exodeoxyribonuclease V beta subunit
MKEQKIFEVETIGLEGSKLIEASAGTGKTYSVALLVLRLLLEKDIPVNKILMVTFTKSAAAELESRIRKFVRQAEKFVTGGEIKESKIREAVGKPDEEKRTRLRKAVRSLDYLSVMTIHSFCQKTISEFTFETNQAFDFEIVKDDTFLFEELVNSFRREVVNAIEDYDWFREINGYLKFDKMSEILRKSISGGKFLDIDMDQQYDLVDDLRKLSETTEILKEKVFRNFDAVKTARIRANAILARHRKSPEQFFPVFILECCLAKKFTDVFEFLYEPEGRELGEVFKRVKYAFYASFINFSKAAIQKIKQEKGIISYDDQISTIHDALENENFIKKLAEKYRAVFIDEFQDTDKHQYEIFRKVFADSAGNDDDKPVIFYIGDPKQSIYAWRGADLDTYKKAKEDVGGSVFTMDKNFRATGDMVEALNILLDPSDDFNMFEDEEIRYIEVKPGAGDLGTMSDNGDKVKPVTIWKFDDNNEKTNFRLVAEEVYRLLTEEVKIKGEKLKPGDIGILVRDNREGDIIKAELSEFNIPAVKRDNALVLKSKESTMVRNLIVAVLSPTRGDICRALNSSYAGFNSLSLKTLDDEKHIEVFMGLRKTLNEDGIYNMIASFLDIYDFRSRCMKDVRGQRVMTNINQVSELLHAAEKKYKYSPSELVVWMDRSRENSDDDFEQRIESDENAVQISTIHKAKGLEYKIVFAPCLSMIPKQFFLNRGQLNEYKKGGEYLFTLNLPDIEAADRKIFDLQKEQENRRLVYVALTRAVYKCYISLVPQGDGESPVISSLSAILDKYPGHSDLIEIKDRSENDIDKLERKYKQEAGMNEFLSKTAPEKLIIKNTFSINSYSALSQAHFTAPFEKTELGPPEDYEQFIFQDLGRGANVGTALHAVFERLDFNNHDSWKQTLLDASEYWSNLISKEKLPLFRMLLEHVMNATISLVGPSFNLAEITTDNKLPELEFYFSVGRVNKTVINDLLSEDTRLGGEIDIEGLMTGSIDLAFRHNGKYYILDWKSNHLGNSVDNYDTAGMETAMTGSNYHLQYKIYTVALIRWLKSRIPDFDYEKHFGGIIYVFLRGVREGSDTGIYTALPDKNEIDDLDKALRGELQEAD